MPHDYPAAHSMDSVWFAVDADGRVAAFDTGENGHIPSEGNEGFGWEVLVEMERAAGLADNEDKETGERCKELGLFYYDFGNRIGPVSPYDRLAVPPAPVHVNQLPPPLRRRVRVASFPGLRFADAECIQPLERYPCDGYDLDDETAYLCADGKTVKPIPGAEEFFRDWVRAFQKESPEQAAGLIFDGPPSDEAKE